MYMDIQKHKDAHSTDDLDCDDSSDSGCLINILRPQPNGCNIADNIFKCIFLNENH